MESIIERNKRIGADVKRAAFMVKQQQSYEFKKKVCCNSRAGIRWNV